MEEWLEPIIKSLVIETFKMVMDLMLGTLQAMTQVIAPQPLRLQVGFGRPVLVDG